MTTAKAADSLKSIVDLKLSGKMVRCRNLKGQFDKSPLSVKERIERLSKPEPNTGCWIWMGNVRSTGYGEIRINGTKTKAHRASYQAHAGKIPNGLHVLHRCDIPLCVNPDHLFIGTHKDNMDDMVKKGRQAKGDCNGNSTLTNEIVLAVREAQGRGVDIAKQFGITESHVSRIKNKLRWKHL